MMKVRINRLHIDHRLWELAMGVIPMVYVHAHQLLLIRLWQLPGYRFSPRPVNIQLGLAPGSYPPVRRVEFQVPDVIVFPVLLRQDGSATRSPPSILQIPFSLGCSLCFCRICPFSKLTPLPIFILHVCWMLSPTVYHNIEGRAMLYFFVFFSAWNALFSHTLSAKWTPPILTAGLSIVSNLWISSSPSVLIACPHCTS